jgi:uncharacterized protein (TIGR03435 family)
MRSLALIIAVVIASTPPLSQTTAKNAAFEAASVKPGDPYDSRVGFHLQPGGRLSTTNTPLKMLIGYAYDANNRIMGGPNWLDSATFNIEAKADSATPFPSGPDGEARMRLMLQSLLSERFKLSVHWDNKDEQIYELVIAKGGPKLKEPDATAKTPRMQVASGHFIGTSEPLSLLARNLSQRLGRSVVDKTGLTGNYDFELTYTPDPGQNGVVGQPVADPNSPSIFVALEEQLGLKLQATKARVQVLVIDSVQKLSEN